MFLHLTRYLLKFHRLTLPHVGTFELVTLPPRFDVVEKVIHPPVFRVELKDNKEPHAHQLKYLTALTGEDERNVSLQLEGLGKNLDRELKENKKWNWKGVALIIHADGKLFVEDQLQPLSHVRAHKLIRSDAVHQVLVGDTERSSDKTNPKLKRQYGSLRLVIAWVLIILMAALIFFFVYRSGFNPHSSGLRKIGVLTSSSIFSLS